MIARHLLYVDDVEQQRVLFRDAIDEWNEANPERLFSFDLAASYDEGVSALRRTRYDGALFDLRLPSPGVAQPERPLGNELAQLGLHEFGIPVAIISGKPDEIDPEFANSKTVKIVNKGDGGGFAEAVAWFGGLWAMLATMAAARARIRKISAGLFAERIWPAWKDYVSISETEDLTPVLARQYVWHLGEVMGATDGQDGDMWHPLEAWICPPLHADRASTGDVVLLDERLWIILTPPCDLANAGKVENVLLAHCSRELPDDWDDILEKCSHAEEGRQKKGKERLRKLFNQPEQALHFLPPLPKEVKPVSVEFGHVRTLPICEFEKLLAKRIGSVTVPFVNNLIQRFGAYISRVGQPNLNVEAFPRHAG